MSRNPPVRGGAGSAGFTASGAPNNQRTQNDGTSSPFRRLRTSPYDRPPAARNPQRSNAVSYGQPVDLELERARSETLRRTLMNAARPRTSAYQPGTSSSHLGLHAGSNHPHTSPNMPPSQRPRTPHASQEPSPSMYRPQSVPRAWSGPTNTWNTVGHSSRHVNIVNSDDDEDASDIDQNDSSQGQSSRSASPVAWNRLHRSDDRSDAMSIASGSVHSVRTSRGQFPLMNNRPLATSPIPIPHRYEEHRYRSPSAAQQPVAGTSASGSGMPHSAARSLDVREWRGSQPDTSSPDLSAVEWEKYAHQVKGSEGASRWECLWTAESDQGSVKCSYEGKKQLVKRHVETTHLKYKRFVCEICSKGFPQKTSLETHMHGHTGATPHECKFNCGLSFKDPARRHRHMREEHGYVPKATTRKYSQSQSPAAGPSS